jgi:hypothetical protein
MASSTAILGYRYLPFTLRAEDSTRSSTEVAFLSLTVANTSLNIYQSGMARNLLFDENKRVTGVNVTVLGMKPYTPPLSQAETHGQETPHHSPLQEK